MGNVKLEAKIFFSLFMGGMILSSCGSTEIQKNQGITSIFPILIFVFCISILYLGFSLRSARKDALAFEERYSRLFDDASLGIFRATLNDINMTVNPAYAHMFGYGTPEELLAVGGDEGGYRYVDPGCRKEVVANLMKTGSLTLEVQYRRKDGTIFPATLHAWVVKGMDGVPQYFEGYVEDITERKQADGQLARQIRRLDVLQTVETAISSNIDLEAVLKILLEHMRGELGVAAADILVLDPQSQVLVCGAHLGFNTDRIAATRLKLGEGYAGVAARERRLVRAFAADSGVDKLLASPMLGDEGFVLYFGVPLMVKNLVLGVLEVFSRIPLIVDDDWEKYLQILAGQAAIAIDNATLYGNLKTANSKLLFAYDETIEAWARALELYDKKTNQHSQRVTENILVMSIALGIKDGDELVNAYRGAVLHDIGKMGIPESILNKPGKLTEEEWKIMRQHPRHAYNLLSPIEFLQKAVDIPYCHHEKWDGTGYPRGLKGEEIPLSARLFAIVDVWDALLDDRPYRNAWTEEHAREYLRTQMGKHFDPRVVEVFLQRF